MRANTGWNLQHRSSSRQQVRSGLAVVSRVLLAPSKKGNGENETEPDILAGKNTRCNCSFHIPRRRQHVHTAGPVGGTRMAQVLRRREPAAA